MVVVVMVVVVVVVCVVLVVLVVVVVVVVWVLVMVVVVAVAVVVVIGTLEARLPSLMGAPLPNCSHSWEASLQMKSNTTNFTNIQAPRPRNLRDSTEVGCPITQKLAYTDRQTTHDTSTTTSHSNDSEGPRSQANLRGSPRKS